MQGRARSDDRCHLLNVIHAWWTNHSVRSDLGSEKCHLVITETYLNIWDKVVQNGRYGAVGNDTVTTKRWTTVGEKGHELPEPNILDFSAIKQKINNIVLHLNPTIRHFKLNQRQAKEEGAFYWSCCFTGLFISFVCDSMFQQSTM